MGFEYDYVFDWMVKKPAIEGPMGSAQKEEDKNNEAGNDNGANSTGNNFNTQQQFHPNEGQIQS